MGDEGGWGVGVGIGVCVCVRVGGWGGGFEGKERVIWEDLPSPLFFFFFAGLSSALHLFYNNI